MYKPLVTLFSVIDYGDFVVVYSIQDIKKNIPAYNPYVM